MATATTSEQLQAIDGNFIDGEIIFEQSKITINGEKNYVFAEPGVRLKNSVITINGDHNVVYLRASKHPVIVNVTLNGGSAFYLGEDNYFNGKLSVILSEHKHVVIGARCLFSFGIWVRLADPHLIYDIESKKRINLSESVFIGDHCWVGQDALVLKGTRLGSGSIVAARGVCAGIEVPSNCIAGGVPAQVIRSGVFFDDDHVHHWSADKTAEKMFSDATEGIFHVGDDTVSFSDLDGELDAADSALLKMVVLDKIAATTAHDRFAIAAT